MKPGPKATLENFQKRFEARYIPEPNTGCFLWLGNPINSGYGLISFRHHNELAHRAAWLFSNGPIPGNLWVLHKCDVKLCVNPRHLFLGTNSDNQKDAIQKGVKVGVFYHHEKQKMKSCCLRGHDLTPQNTFLQFKNGKPIGRKCRKCHADLERKRRSERNQSMHDLANL